MSTRKRGRTQEASSSAEADEADVKGKSKVAKTAEAAEDQASVELVELDEEAERRFRNLLNVDPSSDEFPSAESLAERFREIAEVLLREAVLYICHTPWRLAEIEFYYQTAKHPDYFTHCDEQQKTNAQWYLHKSGKAYRSGTFKGLDLTFGGPLAYGGILIRSIQSLTGSQFLEGPCVCVDNIMSITKAAAVKDLATLLEANGLSIFPPAEAKKRRQSVLYFGFPKVQPTKLSASAAKFAAAAAGSASIQSFFGSASGDKGKEAAAPSSSPKKESPAPALTIYTSPRVGLTLKRSSGGNHKNPLPTGGSSSSGDGKPAVAVSSAQEDWLMKPYRYMSQIQKMRKGKHYIIVALHHLYKLSEEENVAASKTPKATVQKFIKLFEDGKKGSIQKFVDQQLTPEDVCQLWGAIVAAQAAKASPAS